MSVVLGVDAGGTRTTAAVADANARILARAEEGPGAVRPGAAETAAETITRACLDALQRARATVPARTLVVGAAGAGREPERTQLEQALAAAGIAERVVVVTDAQLALSAAFGWDPGIVLIAGTGSIAWARLPDGSLVRAGGLGSLLGDHGSGFDLALRALRSALLAHEGMGHPTRLLQKIANHLDVAPGDLPRWAMGATPADIAALAPDVLDCAKEKDPIARAIVRDAAAMLALHVAVLVSRFPEDSVVPVAFGGGLLTRRADYRRKVATALKRFAPATSLERQPVDAALGAVRLALRA
jgi:N-acetylglucosamine kinase-like BadF-type ATPase